MAELSDAYPSIEGAVATTTSGLPEMESFGSPLLDDGRVSFEKEVEWLVRQPLDFPVGTQSYYRNTNYSLLSLIVEHLWDMPFEQCLKKRLFTPLGMDTMACEYNEKKVSPRAYGYELKDGKICRAPYGNMNIMYGGGFTVGKLADMTKFYRAIREKKLLKPETWELVFTRADVGVFGLGCYVIKDVGLTCYQHTGGSAGFRNMHRYYPDLDLESHSYDMHKPGGRIGHGGVMTALTTEQILDDLEMSSLILKTNDAFAYPFGDVDALGTCRNAVEQSGFLVGVTTRYGKARPGMDPYLLPRMRVNGRNSLMAFKTLL
jgi:CubicO group peptidase (beta-lactamase class C family)